MRVGVIVVGDPSDAPAEVTRGRVVDRHLAGELRMRLPAALLTSLDRQDMPHEIRVPAPGPVDPPPAIALVDALDDDLERRLEGNADDEGRRLHASAFGRTTNPPRGPSTTSS